MDRGVAGDEVEAGVVEREGGELGVDEGHVAQIPAALTGEADHAAVPVHPGHVPAERCQAAGQPSVAAAHIQRAAAAGR